MEGPATITTGVIVAAACIGGLMAARTPQVSGARVVVIEKAPNVARLGGGSGCKCWMANDLPTRLSVH